MIEVSDLYKSFGKLQVLNGLNVSFKKGTCVSLVGPNASGKTTLLKIILGMVRKTRGTVRVNGRNVEKDFSYREFIGYMPQIGRYPDNMKVGQVVDLVKAMRPGVTDYDNTLIREFKLDEVADKRISVLSGGTRQKVSASLAFLFRTPVLILDEPTAGLDPLSSEILKEKIKSETGDEKLLIVTSHILSDLEDISTDIIYLNEGKVVMNDTIEGLLEKTSEEHLSQAIASLMKNSGHA